MDFHRVRGRAHPRGRTLGALLVAALAFTTPARAAEVTSFGKCADDGRFVCGTIVVPLDHSGRLPGSVRLRFAWNERAGAGEPAVVALMGGPGQAGLPYKTALEQMTDSIPGRNLLVLDQRGIGESDPLRCPGIDNRFEFTAAAIERCSDLLGERARFFTSYDTVRDLEALREALEIPAYTLFGISYGTYVAQLYARHYPLRSERLLLDSVVSSEAFDPFFHYTFQAIPRIVGNLCPHGCPGVSDDLRADLDRLLARLERDPLRGTIFDSKRRRRRPYTLHGDTVFGLVMGSDYEPRGFVRAALPAAIRSALEGDPQPFARLEERALTALALEPRVPDAEFTAPAHLAAFCGDTAMPWAASVTGQAERERALRAAVDARPAEHFGRFRRSIALQLGALDCTHWRTAGPRPPQPPLSRLTPALMVSGEEDARTPLEEAQPLLGLLPVNAWLLTVPGAGHSVFGSGANCAYETLDAILYEIREAIGAGCPPAEPIDVDRPYPRSAPSPRDAVALTAEDVESLGTVEVLSVVEAVLAGRRVRTRTYWTGGLRGGHAEFRLDPNHTERSTLRLRRFSLVPGLALTGTLRMWERNEQTSYWIGRVRARGRFAGTLEFGKRAVAGRLGGRRVRVSRSGSVTLSRVRAASAGRRPTWTRPPTPLPRTVSALR